MTKNTKKLGDLGEDLVLEYLKNKKVKILDRNFRGKRGELDIIYKEGRTIVVLEVKAGSAGHGENLRPEVHFTKTKYDRILKTTYIYLSEKGYSDDVDIRIDLAVVVIDKDKQIGRVRYYKNVFI